MKNRFLALGFVFALAACASAPPTPVPNPTPGSTSAGDAALATTAGGQNVVAWLNGLNANLASLQTTANGVIQASQPALQNMLALGNTLYTAYQIAAPALGASASDNTAAAASIATLKALASGNATDVGSALVAAAGATAALKAALNDVAPQAAAAVTVPAVAPAS